MWHCTLCSLSLFLYWPSPPSFRISTPTPKCSVALPSVFSLRFLVPPTPRIHHSSVTPSLRFQSPAFSWVLLCFSRKAGYGSLAGCATKPNTYFKLHVIKSINVTLECELTIYFILQKRPPVAGRSERWWVSRHYRFTVKATRLISVFPSPWWFQTC